MLAKTSARPERLLTVLDVAKQLAVSPSLVYQLVESERLAHHRIGTGRGTIRISQTDLDSYLTACRAESPEKTAPPIRRKRLKHIRL